MAEPMTAERRAHLYSVGLGGEYLPCDGCDRESGSCICSDDDD